jgi:hypothetical protein
MRRVLSLASITLAGSLLIASGAFGSTVIGAWTSDTSDQWIDWATQSSYAGGATSLPTPEYTFANDGIAGGDSLLITKSGFAQDLAVKLEYIPGAMAAFEANNALQVTMTVPYSANGFTQIYQLALNAPGWGFNGLTPSPVPFAEFPVGGPNNGLTTYTLDFSYATALASIPANPGYAEFIFATNNGSGASNQYYIDNVSLVTVPEPATCGLLFGGVLPLLAARRRRPS